MSPFTPAALAAIGAAYLLGSVSFAVLVSRLMGLPDPHSYGSGNPGATNVLRTGNKVAALFTLLGDSLKGAIAVVIARAVSPSFGLDAAGTDLVLALVALAAFAGHVLPVFHGFRGGKGVATAGGALLALEPFVGLGTLLTWLTVAGFFRYSSLAAIAAAVLAPLWDVLLFGVRPTTYVIAAIGALLLLRHRSNIRKLLAGAEGRIGEKKQPQPK